MFDSITEILEQYIDKANRFTIWSVDAQRGENPEDVFYLCHVANNWYVVYETDYIDTNVGPVDEIRERFVDIEPLYWLVIKSQQINSRPHHLSLKTHFDDTSYNLLVHKKSHLRFAVLSVALKDTTDGSRFHPGTFGNFEK